MTFGWVRGSHQRFYWATSRADDSDCQCPEIQKSEVLPQLKLPSLDFPRTSQCYTQTLTDPLPLFEQLLSGAQVSSLRSDGPESIFLSGCRGQRPAERSTKFLRLKVYRPYPPR